MDTDSEKKEWRPHATDKKRELLFHVTLDNTNYVALRVINTEYIFERSVHTL